jgi:hypothetical protein
VCIKIKECASAHHLWAFFPYVCLSVSAKSDMGAGIFLQWDPHWQARCMIVWHTDLFALLLTSENVFRNLKKPSENPRRKLQREMPSFSNSLQRYAAAAAFPLLVPRIPLSSSRSRIRFGVGYKVTFGLYRCLLFALTC